MKLNRFPKAIINIIAITAIVLTGCEEAQKNQTQQTAGTQQQIADTDQTPTPTRIPARKRTPRQAPAPAETQTQQTTTQENKTEPQQGTPNIDFEKLEHDFGDMNPSDRSQCTFVFKNTGKSELIVNKRIKSTCGCTVPTLEKDKYQPGESGEILVKFHAPSRPGKTTKSIYVSSNDPDNPRQQLKVAANVVVAVDYEPKNIELSMIQENAGAPEITIRSVDNKEFAIVSSSSTNNTVNVKADPKTKASSFTVNPTVDLEKLKQYPHGNLTIKIDHPSLSRIVIPYSAPMLYRVSRPNLIIKDVQPGQEVIKNDIFIASNYGENFKVVSTESNRGYIEVIEQEKLQDGRTALKLKITAPEKEKGKFSFNDQLKITLDNGFNLSVNCYGIYAR